MHDHAHTHDHNHDHCCHSSHAALTEPQADFMHHLEHHHFLPVARFLVESSQEDDFCSVALAPVYLRGVDEELSSVRKTAELLLALEQGGYITLDYDYPLDGYAYTEYQESAIYAYFSSTVAEGKDRPGFLGDTPRLELGSIAPRSAEHPT